MRSIEWRYFRWPWYARIC